MQDNRRREITDTVNRLRRDTEDRERRLRQLEHYRTRLVEDVQLTFLTEPGKRVLDFLVATYLDGQPTIPDLLQLRHEDGRPYNNEDALNAAHEAAGAARLVKALIAGLQGKVNARI